MDVAYIIGEFITIGTMAFAFSMDSFSFGMGMGVLHLTIRRMGFISLLTGFFHTIMPLIGMGIGKMLSVHFGEVAIIAGGILITIIGISMIHSSFQFNRRTPAILPYGIGSLIFPLTVSVDSLSAGLSLGMFGARVIVTIAMFGIISTILTMGGLLLGRKFHRVFGGYSVAIGGVILFAFGVKMIVPYVV